MLIVIDIGFQLFVFGLPTVPKHVAHSLSLSLSIYLYIVQDFSKASCFCISFESLDATKKKWDVGDVSCFVGAGHPFSQSTCGGGGSSW